MKNKQWVFLLLIIIAHLLCFVGALVWGNIYNGDSQEYFSLANNLKHGIYYAADASKPIDPFYISLRTPLYSYFILIIESVFGKHDWIILIFQNIISIFNCFFALKIFQGFCVAKYQWIYWMLIITYPAQMLFANMIVPDILLQTFIILYVKDLFRFLDKHRLKECMLTSLWLMLAFLVKPVIYFFIIVHIVIVLYILIKDQLNKRLLFIAMLPLIMTVCYGFYMKSLTGFYHITGLQPHNFITIQLLQLHEKKYGSKKALEINDSIRNELSKEKTFKDWYQKTDELCIDTFKANFGLYTSNYFSKTLRYFVEPGKGEIDLFTGHNSYDNIFSHHSESFYTKIEKNGWRGGIDYLKNYPWLPLIIIIVFFNIVRLLGFILFVFDKKINWKYRTCVFLIVLYFAAITGPLSNFTRYYLPVLGITSGAAMVGFANFIERKRFKKSLSNTDA